MFMQGRRAVGLLLVGVLICGTATACGSDSPSEGSQTSVTLPPADQVRDTETAKAMLLRADDAPSAFTASTRYPDFDRVSDAGDERDLPRACENVDLAPSPLVNAMGELFVKNEQTPVMATALVSDVSIYEKTQDAQDDFRALTNKSNQLCTLRLFEPTADRLHNVLTGNSLASSANLTYLPELTSADSFGLRITAVTSVERQSANLYVDVIGYTKDRANVSAIVASVSGEPSLEMEKDLLAKLRKRYTEAASSAK